MCGPDFCANWEKEYMASLAKFDDEIKKTREKMDEMKSKLEQSGVILDKFADTETIGQIDFDIENAASMMSWRNKR